MRIHRVLIENFRGIRTLDWCPKGRFSCLIGPGNSAKTTILDAIEIALLPRWYTQLSDDDFCDADSERPIKIEVTVGELPAALIHDEHLGHHLRGWSETNGIEDEPADDLEPVVTIRFTLDKALEPSWKVVNDRIPDGVVVNMRDREKLGVTRIGEDCDRQLTWMRGSALPRLAKGASDASDALAAATRGAREIFASSSLPSQFGEAATMAHTAAKDFGAAPAAEYAPKLGGAATVSLGAMELFEGVVPARMAGLGSRRLAALGIQCAAINDGAILLIDEVEAGLEPHRIATLLDKLAGSGVKHGHAIVTTHSPVVLRELKATNLSVIRRSADKTTVRDVDASLQDVVRSVPEALLATRLLVCEGRTEYGLVDMLTEEWARARNTPLAHLGARLVNGSASGGSNAAPHAAKLRSLGHDVALFADSDVGSTPTDAALQAAGVSVIRWSHASNSELRIASDLPEAGLQDLVTFAVDLRDSVSVVHSFRAILGPAVGSTTIAEWLHGGATLPAIRTAIGAIANKQKWFKDIDRGRSLGDIVLKHWSALANTDLRAKLEAVEQWLYA